MEHKQRRGIRCGRIKPEEVNQQQRWLTGEVSFEKEARGKYLRRDEEEIKKQSKTRKALILLLRIAREDVIIYSLQLLQGQEKSTDAV